MQSQTSATRVGRMTDDRATVRTRPTNNQLLYKAYFRWNHYPVPNSPIYDVNETDACASVTAAFLQVMRILQEVEALHCPTQRNVLKILSQDTRHTKVVNLACGTHRVSDELKKHFLTDIDGTQYTTNLDRNRYGADNQYMFTVIRHNLSTLGLCPCLVDVEVLDQKSNETVMVSAGIEACVCEESWHDVKDDKMSCDGQSCSPDSSAPSEEKSSGKSTSFNQIAAPGSSHKRFSQSQTGECFGPTVNNKSGHSTMANEFDAAIGLASFNGPLHQGFSRRAKKTYGKSASSIAADTLLDMTQHKPRYRFGDDQEESGGFGKRTRENENGEGIYWEFQNTAQLQKVNAATKTALGVDYKRMKSNFSQLSFNSEQIIDEVCKMKSKLSGMDPLRFQIEEDNARIRRMEDELIALKMEIRRHVAESRQWESQLLANRRVIGMLLNRLQQSLGCNQEIGGCCLQPGVSRPSDRECYAPADMMESLISQQNGFHEDSGTGLLPGVTVPTMPVPNSMMIASANNAPNGVNGHRVYDSEWVSANGSTANTGSPSNVAAQPVMCHPNPDDQVMSDKRVMTGKMDPQPTPCGYQSVHDSYGFTYGSV